MSACTLYHDDGVFTCPIIDHDSGVAAALFGIFINPIKAHPLLPIKVPGHFAKSIASQLGDQTNVTIKSSCSHRLVRTFAARTELKRDSKNRFSPFGHSLCPTSQIGNKRSQDTNFRLRHGSVLD